MWLLRLKGKLELTEAQVPYWDAVPQNVEIEAMALAVPRNGAAPYVVELKGFEAYCCARIGNAPMGAAGASSGWALYGLRGDQVTELEITAGGMKLKNYPQGKSELPERCWRRGVI